MKKTLAVVSLMAAVTLTMVASSVFFDGTPARAQTGAACDSSKVLGSCSAHVRIDNGRVLLTSSVNECSIVDWRFGGNPQTTVVRGGYEEVPLASYSDPDATLSVDGCRIVETLDAAEYDQPRSFTIKCGHMNHSGDLVYTDLSVMASSREEAAAEGNRRCKALDSGLTKIGCSFRLPDGSIIRREVVGRPSEGQRACSRYAEQFRN